MRLKIRASTAVVLTGEEAAIMQYVAQRAATTLASADIARSNDLDSRGRKIAAQFAENMAKMEKFHGAVADFHSEHNIEGQHDDE